MWKWIGRAVFFLLSGAIASAFAAQTGDGKDPEFYFAALTAFVGLAAALVCLCMPFWIGAFRTTFKLRSSMGDGPGMGSRVMSLFLETGNEPDRDFILKYVRYHD